MTKGKADSEEVGKLFQTPQTPLGPKTFMEQLDEAEINLSRVRSSRWLHDPK